MHIFFFKPLKRRKTRKKKGRKEKTRKIEGQVLLHFWKQPVQRRVCAVNVHVTKPDALNRLIVFRYRAGISLESLEREGELA